MSEDLYAYSGERLRPKLPKGYISGVRFPYSHPEYGGFDFETPFIPPMEFRPPRNRHSYTPNLRRSVSPFSHAKHTSGYAGIIRKPDLPQFVRPNLRKTYSEPSELSAAEFGVNSDDWLGLLAPTEAARPARRSTTRSPSRRHRSTSQHRSESRHRTSGELSISGEDSVFTDIQELQDAANSIAALKRNAKRKRRSRKHNFSPISPTSSFADYAPVSPNGHPELGSNLGRKSGITSGVRGSHPRGVMQFIPSMKPYSDDHLLSENQLKPRIQDENLLNYNTGLYDSVPKNMIASYSGILNDTLFPLGDHKPRMSAPDVHSDTLLPERKSSLTRFGNRFSFNQARPVQVNRQYSFHERGAYPETALEDSFSRFNRLLRSLQTSNLDTQDLSSSSSGSIESSKDGARPVSMSTSWHQGWSRPPNDIFGDEALNQADAYLWKRRSRSSLKRHARFVRPLKRPELCTLIEPSLVDEMFFQIPEILVHHELLYAALKVRLVRWDETQKIGDVLVNIFSKQSMIDSYTAFIDNWRNARQVLRLAMETKTAFSKYIERCMREVKNKLPLDALLIMPVQRLPRYELLVKELLKHTSVDHPDAPLLVQAQREIRTLCSKINRAGSGNDLGLQMQQQLREIEAIVDGLDDLVTSERKFYKYNLVIVQSPSGPKHRCLFLFSDLLVVTSIKPKTVGSLRRNTSAGIFGSSSNAGSDPERAESSSGGSESDREDL